MELTGSTHPPGGALSILYIAVPSIQVLGYWYIVAALAGVIILFIVALIFDNLSKTKRYPAQWL